MVTLGHWLHKVAESNKEQQRLNLYHYFIDPSDPYIDPYIFISHIQTEGGPLLSLCDYLFNV